MIRNSPELCGMEIKRADETSRRIIVSLFADDTTVYLSRDDHIGTLNSIQETWCLASGAKFNKTKTKAVPVGPKEYRRFVKETGFIDPENATNQLPVEIEILGDGSSTRILGGYIGNNINEMELWLPVSDKVSQDFRRWARLHPTFQGRMQASRVEIGGRTQFLTMAQGMPEPVERALSKAEREFFWGNTGSKPGKQTEAGN
ncbi:hypothetical protein DL93DRAFT_2204071 [Clavulina sp. PMI_390]|nr:hypothetical protein DL93DRAFT_2204071 [Clavulina sp. PMI_390]